MSYCSTIWYKIYIIKIFKVKIHDKILPHILYVLRVYDLFPMLMQKKKTKECKSFKCQIANNVVLRLTRAWLLSFLIFGICLVLWTKICDGLSFIFEYRSSFFFTIEEKQSLPFSNYSIVLRTFHCMIQSKYWEYWVFFVSLYQCRYSFFPFFAKWLLHQIITISDSLSSTFLSFF